MKKVIIISITLFICSLWLGISFMNGSNIDTTIRFEMDEKTMNYLMEHNYCMMNIRQPFSMDDVSEKPDVMFFGECNYLNYSLATLEVK